MTEELRVKSQQRTKLDILYVTGRSTPFAHMRGENLMKAFKNFYDKVADISLTIVDVKKSNILNVELLSQFNLVWLDNVIDFNTVKSISESISEITKSIDPQISEKLSDTQYLSEVNKKRQDKIRVVTAVDEFYWEGVAGRETSLGNVKLIESAMAISDTIVVPTVELKDLITQLGLVDADQVEVLKSSAPSSFYPMFKYSKKTGSKIAEIGKKAKVLVKGIEIPKNVQNFIIANHKRFEITISSVGELSKDLMYLVSNRSVKHIIHWANPKVDYTNMTATHAIDRDGEFDFTVLTYTENPSQAYYELCMGDEDAIHAISSGSLPVFIAGHLFDADDECLANINKDLNISPTDSHKAIESAIAKYSVGVNYNSAFEKASNYTRNFVMESPIVLGSVFTIAIGKELAWAKSQLLEEAKERLNEKLATETEEVK